jgi:hypothetical protein
VRPGECGSGRVGGLDDAPALVPPHDPPEGLGPVARVDDEQVRGNGHAFLAWTSGVVGSAEKPARGAAGGGCEGEPRDHADAEGQDEQGGGQPDSGQQHAREDGKTDGEYGDEGNSGHRALDVPAKTERETHPPHPRARFRFITEVEGDDPKLAAFLWIESIRARPTLSGYDCRRGSTADANCRRAENAHGTLGRLDARGCISWCRLDPFS